MPLPPCADLAPVVLHSVGTCGWSLEDPPTIYAWWLTYPSEKYEWVAVGMIIPNYPQYMEK